ncbi:MAG: hypothetical protein AAF611_11450 [Bacteroidota bacterium]
MKKALLISPIGDVGSPIRTRANFIEQELVKKGLKDTFRIEVRRADKITDPTQKIYNKIINDIISCDLLIVDTTNNNPNVMFELGIGVILDKPLLLLRNKNQINRESIPFDIQDLPFLSIPMFFKDYNDDYKKLEEDIKSSKVEISKGIKSFLENKESKKMGVLPTEIKETINGFFKSNELNKIQSLEKEKEGLLKRINELNGQLENDQARKTEYFISKLNQVSDINDLPPRFIDECCNFGDELEVYPENLVHARRLYNALLIHQKDNESVYYRLARVNYSIWQKQSTGKKLKSEELYSSIKYANKVLAINPNYPNVEWLMEKLKKEMSNLKQ